MDWVASIHQAIQYIEEHLREELTIREIRRRPLSPFTQKGLPCWCGITAGDHIRQRRLSAAGLEVLTTDRKIIDIALGSATFAGQLHQGFCPIPRSHTCRTAKKRRRGPPLCFPLRIKVTLEGGQNMDCKIMKKEAFTVLCRAKTFKYEDASRSGSQFWAAFPARRRQGGLRHVRYQPGRAWAATSLNILSPTTTIRQGRSLMATHPPSGPYLGGVPLY